MRPRIAFAAESSTFGDSLCHRLWRSRSTLMRLGFLYRNSVACAAGTAATTDLVTMLLLFREARHRTSPSDGRLSECARVIALLFFEQHPRLKAMRGSVALRRRPQH